LKKLKKGRKLSPKLLESSTPASESEPQMASEDPEMVLVADLVYANGQVHLVEVNKFGGDSTGCGSSLSFIGNEMRISCTGMEKRSLAVFLRATRNLD
jgi:hypothetical protein